MKKLFTLLFSMLICMGCYAELPEYSIVGEGTGQQGTYLVKVTVTSKKKHVEDATLAACAVHGVLFRGFANSKTRQTQKPLAGSAAAEASHQEYFDNFFDGTAAGYVNEVPGSRSVMKSDKKYKISAIYSVNKDQLRKDLEAAGVIRGLNSMF